MTTLHLRLEEAKIERVALIGGTDSLKLRKLVVSGHVDDLLGYDFITSDASSSNAIANYLEISIYATEDERELAERAWFFIGDRELSININVSPTYFSYISNLADSQSLRISIRLDVLLTPDEVKDTFWGMSTTRELGFKRVEVDQSYSDTKIIKSGVEIDSKCEMIAPTLTISSSVGTERSLSQTLCNCL